MSRNTALFKQEVSTLSYRYKTGPVLASFTLLLSFVIYVVLYAYPRSIAGKPAAYLRLAGLLVALIFPWFSLLSFGAERKRKTLSTLFSLPYSEEMLTGVKLGASALFLIPSALSALLWYALSGRWYAFSGAEFVGAWLEYGILGALALTSSAYFSIRLKHSRAAPPVGQLFMALPLAFMGLASVVATGSALFRFFTFFSYSSRFYDLRSGILNCADLAYFGLWILFFVHGIVARLRLERNLPRRFPWTLLVVALFFILWSLFPLRVNLNGTGVYGVSPVTKHTLERFQDPLYLTYCVSPGRAADPEAKRVYRLLTDYARLKKNVYVKRILIHDEVEAGVYALRAESAPSRFAGLYGGVYVEYRDKSAVIPLLIDADELQYRVTGKLLELLDGRKSVTLIEDADRSAAQFSFLRSILNEHFDITEWAGTGVLPRTDAYWILGDRSIDRINADKLMEYNSRGAGIISTVSSVGVPLLDRGSLERREPSTWENALSSMGLRVDNNLLLDPDGLVVQSKTDRSAVTGGVYLPWVRGRPIRGKSPINTLFSAFDPLYAQPLWITNDAWAPLVSTGVQVYRQDGILDLSPASLARKPLLEGQGPFIAAAIYLRAEVPFVAIGGNAGFSDLVESAGAWSNLAIAEPLAWGVVGRLDIAALKTGYFAMHRPIKPFAPHEDGFAMGIRFVITIFFMGFLIGALFTVPVILRKREKRGGPL